MLWTCVFVLEVNECEDEVLGACGGHGTCTPDEQGHAVCECDYTNWRNRYTGDNCDGHICRGGAVVCYNGGTCE